MVIEALSSFGWHRYTGLDSRILSLDHFGESAPTEIIFKKYGFSVENIAAQVQDYLL